MAHAFNEEKTLYLSADSVSDLRFKLDLIDVYGKFIERKCDIYQLEMSKASLNIVVAKEQKT